MKSELVPYAQFLLVGGMKRIKKHIKLIKMFIYNGITYLHKTLLVTAALSPKADRSKS